MSSSKKGFLCSLVRKGLVGEIEGGEGEGWENGLLLLLVPTVEDGIWLGAETRGRERGGRVGQQGGREADVSGLLSTLGGTPSLWREGTSSPLSHIHAY